jgi:DNA-binding NarL/FixJ family response regulator
MTRQRSERSVIRVHVDPSIVTVGTNEKAWSDTGAWPVSSPRPNVLTNAILVVDRRPFVRGCLASWLGSHGEEFQTLAVADIETVTNNDALKQAALVLFGFDRADTADQWLSSQIEWLRGRCPDVPIALLLEATDVTNSRAVQSVVSRLAVQGYIPTSTSLEVATAALRLVLAGGHYFPRLSHSAGSPELVSIGRTQPIMPGQGVERLTPREEAVLNVLAAGAPNKIIAYRLGMSVFTVKAHVHSIIRKLKVRNRTEAVVAAHASPHSPDSAARRSVEVLRTSSGSLGTGASPSPAAGPTARR